MVVAVLYASCFVDHAGIIARYNATRCAQSGGPGPSIDLPYLESLGPDTLPALEELRRRMAEVPGTGSRDQLAVAWTVFRLRARLDGRLADWRTWYVRGWMAGREGATGAREG